MKVRVGAGWPDDPDDHLVLRLEDKVHLWASTLANDPRLHEFWLQRGVSDETLSALEVGYDRASKRYSIPVRGVGGELLDVKKYKPGAADRKNLHTKDFGSPTRLWGADRLAAEYDPRRPVVFCAGEPDAILLTSLGFLAVTGTSGEGSVPSVDLHLLAGRRVVVSYDADDAGRKGAAKLVAALSRVAAEVAQIELPFEPGEDDKDVTDYLTAGHTPSEFKALVRPLDRADAERLVQRAVEKARDASRNDVGFWLACQLRDERYTREETLAAGRRYAEAVTGLKDKPYAVTEFSDSVEQAFSAPARAAVGPSSVAASDDAHPLNDAGNAARLLDGHADDLKWLPDLGKWAGWDGRTWVVGEALANRYALDVVRGLEARARALVADGEKEAASAMARFASSSGNDSRLRAMLRQAATLPGMTSLSSDLDADPTVLTVLNGTLDLTPGGARLREHRRDDLARALVPREYRPGAQSERWDAFLRAALPDPEVRAFTQRLFGYALFGANPERLLTFLVGPSSTGKSTFVELLAMALGPGVAGPFNLSLLRDLGKEAARPDLVRAMSRRLIHTSEASSEWRLHADTIKRVVGNDSTTARAMRSDDFVERVPAFLPVVATNAPPTIEHSDPALWRRLVVVPFESVAANPNPHLRASFDADDLAAVLAWLVRGWDEYAQHGLADRPAAVLAATQRLRDSLSTLDQFLAERCTPEAEAWTPSAELYGAYEDWCAVSGVHGPDRLKHNQFGEMLEQRGYTMKLRRVGDRTADHKVRGRVGVRVLPVEPTRLPRVVRSAS